MLYLLCLYPPSLLGRIAQAVEALTTVFQCLLSCAFISICFQVYPVILVSAWRSVRHVLLGRPLLRCGRVPCQGCSWYLVVQCLLVFGACDQFINSSPSSSSDLTSSSQLVCFLSQVNLADGVDLAGGSEFEDY